MVSFGSLKPFPFNFQVNPEFDCSKPIRTILVVDDGREVCDCMGKTLAKKRPDILVTCLYKANEVTALIRKKYFDVVLCEIMLDGVNTRGIINKIREFSPTTWIIAMTRHPMKDSWRGILSQPDDFFDKNDSCDQLQAQVEEGLKGAARKKAEKGLGAYSEETDLFEAGGKSAFEKIMLKKNTGFSFRRWRNLRKISKAIGVIESGQGQGKVAAKKAGFHSKQTMDRCLSYFKPYLHRF